MRNIKCQCTDIISKEHDRQSKKMLQAQMLKANKSYKLKYSNSANDTIIQSIISNDFDKNKGLLLCYKMDRYSELASPLILRFPKIDILGLLDKIILSLTTEQYNSVFRIKIDAPVIKDTQLVYKNKKTFYAITADLFGYKSFIIKNYTNDVLIPTYSYTFNLEDPSNLNTKLCLSIDKNWIPYDNLTYIGTPGTPGAYLMITIPQTIQSRKLYVFNAAEPNVGMNYIFWGYNLNYFNILIDSIKDTIVPICTNKPTTMVYNKVPFIDTNNILLDDYTTICMTRSSILLINNTYGANLYIDDIKNKNDIGGYNNNKYGLYSGTYYIYVPQKFELAFLNKNDSNFIYSNNSMDASEKRSRGQIDGTDDIYDFYYGTIKIVVTGSFQPISIYTKNYGYLNGKDFIIYSEKCSTVLEDNNPYLIPY